MSSEPPLLEVTDLRTTFSTDSGVVTAVDGVDFSVEDGQTVCIVGESGSGKTVATESVSRIVKSPPGEVGGSIRLRGREVTEMDDEELRTIRGSDIAHIFQNPQDALNHCYTVGWQITEAVQIHEDVSKETARERGIELLSEVGVANAATRFDDYPHEFSGGQKQRVMIAMALVTNPDLLIADEPTTALDVTVQAEILSLLDRLQEEYGMGVLFVTHDLGVVAEIADYVIVMYAGKVMERGDVYEVFENPSHPYTQALLECLPGRSKAVEGIGGSLPSPINVPDGCRFAPRCDYAVEACHSGEQPPEYETGGDHEASCIYYGPGYDQSVVNGPNTEQTTGAADD
ncbi:MAG: oligopeptide/dipeptide ABC transporter, ATP-binding protein, C-terminal domain protein [halophilic archaeon J07HB67]|jgi:oligopeptide/dipeptide ABC transporter, ATP-binding protein, C-terminal domain|nr:MAG: oligopeptide/dipeptide ABC transporter, ATP-binding protein, C-terminal domain protein [halophilic archaeon J07HB67]